MLAKMIYANDIYLRTLPNGLKDFDFVINKEFVKTKIRHNLLTFLGECFNDTRIGMPYKQRILVNSPDLLSIRSIFYQAIMETPGVANLLDLSLDFDKINRTLAVSFTALLDSNEELQVDARRDLSFILQI